MSFLRPPQSWHRVIRSTSIGGAWLVLMWLFWCMETGGYARKTTYVHLGVYHALTRVEWDTPDASRPPRPIVWHHTRLERGPGFRRTLVLTVVLTLALGAMFILAIPAGESASGPGSGSHPHAT